jgi:hypothetical protein
LEASTTCSFFFGINNGHEVRKLNACAEKGESCGENCTLYPSATGTPLEIFIHSGAHIYPPEVPKMIVSFFRAHSRNP